MRLSWLVFVSVPQVVLSRLAKLGRRARRLLAAGFASADREVEPSFTGKADQTC